MSLIAERLDKAMRERGWDQNELARRVGATQGAISKILVGKTTNSRLMPKIAAQLHKPLPYLLGVIDDDSVDAVNEAYAPEEMEWLDLLRGLQPEDRQALLRLTRSLATSAPSASVHERGLTYRAPESADADVTSFWTVKTGQRSDGPVSDRQAGSRKGKSRQ